MNTLYIKKENIKAWFDAIVKAYDRVVAPVAALDVVAFSQVDSFDKIAPHDSYTQTTRSAKEVLFPRTELLFSYKKEDKKITVKDFDPQSVPSTVLWQVRPCDATSVFPLDAVFNWDYKDKLFNVRREKTTIVAVSCAKADDYCFCSSVGGGAGSTRGSDILLTYTPNGAVVEVSTKKGEALIALAKDLFSDNTEDKNAYVTAVPVVFDLEKLKEKMHGMFDSPVWKEQSERCLGCGACAYVCPTCSCFDIQDNAHGSAGERLRCWDSCGFAQFTLHTSGHNPRPTQATRWRQRLLHKFSYIPLRQQSLGCTGCGRCSRACPVDMNIKEHLISIDKKQ